MRKSLLLLLFTFAVHADVAKVIIPVRGSFPGAFGSQWTTKLVGFNASGEYVRVWQTPGGCAFECPTPPANPQTAFSYDVSGGNGHGFFLYLGGFGGFGASPAAIGQISLNLRIQDLSRQALTWGTELPIITERNVRTTDLTLTGVPTDDRFRAALRVYDYDNATSSMQLRIYSINGSTPIVDMPVTLTTDNSAEEPGQLALTNLTALFPQLPKNDVLRITLHPLTSGMRFFAFVTITNDETQHVTTITPQ